MCVEPELKGQKIGQTLLEAAFARPIQVGTTEMYIESPPPFKTAHRLFRKNGFEMIKEYPEVSIPYELRANWVYMKKSS
jgi:GNAT superfamily N-acetyltransferase